MDGRRHELVEYVLHFILYVVVVSLNRLCCAGTKLTVVAQEAIVGQDHFWRRIGEELRDGLTTDINVSNLGSYPFPVEYVHVSVCCALITCR
jgi:hypothetical protein